MRQQVERRKRRSSDPIIALHHQLAAVRADASFDAMVLADDAGCVMAGAGAWPACEELAAYAPFFVGGTLCCNEQVASEATEMVADVHYQPASVDGLGVVLCAKGQRGKEVAHQMSRALSGCERILSFGP